MGGGALTARHNRYAPGQLQCEAETYFPLGKAFGAVFCLSFNVKTLSNSSESAAPAVSRRITVAKAFVYNLL